MDFSHLGLDHFSDKQAAQLPFLASLRKWDISFPLFKNAPYISIDCILFKTTPLRLKRTLLVSFGSQVF